MASILIADSGFTKTDWRLIKDDGSIEQARTLGINPYYQKLEEMEGAITALSQQIHSPVDQVYFYGTGCSSASTRTKITQLIKGFYPNADIEVNHDLLAAARSLCGKEPGIACILGTGANSCLYNGTNITSNVASLGWAITDEGAGTYLGKMLVTAYFRKEMPTHLSTLFDDEFALTKDDFLMQIYQEPLPGRYLSTFSKFIGKHIKEPFLYELVAMGFDTFLAKNVMHYEGYQELPVHFTGSVAYHFGSILRSVAQDKGVYVKHISEHPIAGLTLFHQ